MHFKNKFSLYILLVISTLLYSSPSIIKKSPVTPLHQFEKDIFSSMFCDKNITRLQVLLKAHPQYFGSVDYSTKNSEVGQYFIDNELSTDTLDLLISNGFDINTLTVKHISSKSRKILNDNDYDTLSYSTDYGRLKSEVKSLLKEQSIDSTNYYAQHRLYDYFFLERLSLNHYEPHKAVSWFLNHGYIPQEYELNKSFHMSINKKDSNLSLEWKAFKKLGVGFKDYNTTISKDYDLSKDKDNRLFQEYLMNVIVYTVMSFHKDEILGLADLSSSGLDINAKDTYGHSNAYNLFLSEDIEKAKVELDNWKSVGLIFPDDVNSYIPMETLKTLVDMNITISNDIEKVIENRNMTYEKSLVEKILFVAYYSPISLTIFFLIFLAVLFFLFIVIVIKVFKRFSKD